MSRLTVTCPASAFVVTAGQFAGAVLKRRAIVSYVTAIILFPIISHFFAQTITITVPEKPVRAGIDPHYLFIYLR